MNEVKLIPLTDESVRGVLVACADDDPHLSIVVDDVTGRKCVGKLRPASEFGVPAKPSAEVRFEANEGVPSLERVQLAIDTLGYYGQFQQGQDGWAALCVLRAHLAALKSTPAEPAQKLVPLPEGVHVFDTVLDRPKRGDLWRNLEQDDWRVADHDWGPAMPRLQVLRRVDPTLYGVDAERVRELEAEVENLKTQLRAGYSDELNEQEHHTNDAWKEVERLRKAIEEAKAAYTTHGVRSLEFLDALEALIYDALSPPAAANGDGDFSLATIIKSTREVLDGNPRPRIPRDPSSKVEAVKVKDLMQEMLEGHTIAVGRGMLAKMLEHLERLAAESGGKAMQCLDEIGEAMTSSAPASASGEEECPCDIERGCAKGDGVRVEGKCTLELKGRSVAPPSAASGEAFQIDPAWLIKMADAEDAVGGLAIGVSPFVSQPPSAPAAESEGDFITVRRSEIEEIARQLDHYIDDVTTNYDDSLVKRLRALLAPKGEGAG